MGLINRIIEWATSGAKTDPGDSYREAGWQYRVRPPRQYWNYVENERDVRINQLVDAEASCRTISPDSDYSSMCEALNPDWADPMTSRNYLSTGTAIKDSCIGWDHANNKPILYILQGNDIYPCESPWDHSASPSLGSALSMSYDTTPDDVMGICSDGDYLFVVYGMSSGGYVKFAKFSLISFTGTDLWGISTSIVYDNIPDSTICDLIVANSTTIGFIISTAAQPSAMTVYSIVKATGVGTAGGGNGTSSDQMDPRDSRLVSDGVRLYWLVYVVSGGNRQYYLNSALISAPTGSPYSPITIGGSVSNSNYSDHFSGLCLCRGIITCSTPVGEVYIYTPGEASSASLVNANNIPDSADDYPVVMKSDGLNVWLYTQKYNGSYCFYRIPSGYFSEAFASGTVEFDRIIVDESTFNANHKMGNLLFDGRDIWFVTEPGDLFRICAPGMR